MRACFRIVLLLALQAGILVAQNQQAMTTSTSDADLAIANVLHAQVDAWNRGDLKGFMAGYWNSPDLVFASGKQETQGWEQVYKRYQAHYQSGDTEMGKLSLGYMKPAHLLAPDIAYVDGDYRLSTSNGKESHGVFTLIFRKFPEGWRVVHDRTCAD